MQIENIDKNFKDISQIPEDLQWFSPLESPFKLYGVFYDETEMCYARMPIDTAKNVNSDCGVYSLNYYTAGGRIKFKTNSPYVYIKASVIDVGVAMHQTLINEYGFTLYSKEKYIGFCSPSGTDLINNNKTKKYVYYCKGINSLSTSLCDYALFMPNYSGVGQVFIGLQKGSIIEKPDEYKYSKPILFYGSSITQGGCASRPGNDYVGIISRKLNVDVVNLGFSGNAKGEPEIADYMSTLNPLIFVVDYDHNAPNVEHLKATHLNLCLKFREKHPKTPMILVSMPTFTVRRKERTKVIKDTYEYLKSRKDDNVYFIDGINLFPKNAYECCTVDNTHPNDLGFYFMAEKISKVINAILNK